MISPARLRRFSLSILACTFILAGDGAPLALGPRAACADAADASAAPSNPPLAAWAEPGLPVTRGLQVWLDATRLAAARAALGQGELRPAML